MQDAKYLLAIMLAAILSASVLSGAIIAAPLTPVFAQDDNDDDENGDDNEGSEEESESEDEQDESEDETEEESEDEQDDAEDESEDEMDDEEHEEESEQELEVEGNEVSVKVEKEGLELDDGLYSVTFACTEPPTTMSFEDAFEVDEGEGGLDIEFQLEDGTYSGCEVSMDDPEMLLASFDAFTVPAEEEADEEEQEEHEEEDEVEEDEHEEESEFKLRTEDDGIEVEVEKEGLNLEDGLYSVTFACADPEVSMSFAEAFEVEDGKGKFETHIALDMGTYSDCHITVDETDVVLADFDSFTVSEDEHRIEVTEKVKEKREQVISRVQEVRERIIEAKQDRPLPFASDLNYTLVALGATADEELVTSSVDLTAWKTNPAVVIMAVTGGEVEIGDSTFSVEIGYAIYSLNHDALRLSALAVDSDSGDIVRLVLRGSAADDTGFPDESGESIDLVFEGSSGPQKNTIAGSELLLEGTLQAT